MHSTDGLMGSRKMLSEDGDFCYYFFYIASVFSVGYSWVQCRVTTLGVIICCYEYCTVLPHIMVEEVIGNTASVHQLILVAKKFFSCSSQNAYYSPSCFVLKTS